MVLGTVRWEAIPRERQPKELKTKQAQGEPSGQVHSCKMVLMMARQETGPCKRRPKMLKEEMDNNLRKPRDLVKNRCSDSQKRGQITLSQYRMKKGNDVADGDDDNALTE
jgi:hypothetical protein